MLPIMGARQASVNNFGQRSVSQSQRYGSSSRVVFWRSHNIKRTQASIREFFESLECSNPTKNSQSLACEYGFEEVVQKFLCDGRVDINADYGCALNVACLNKQIAIIKILLAQPQINIMFLKSSFRYYTAEVRDILYQWHLAKKNRASK